MPALTARQEAAQLLTVARNAHDRAEQTLNRVDSLKPQDRHAALRQAIRDYAFQIEAMRARHPKMRYEELGYVAGFYGDKQPAGDPL